MNLGFGRIDYDAHTVPDNYRCTSCGAHGVKLWRQYPCVDDSELECSVCVGQSQHVDVSTIDADGLIKTDIGHSNQIGQSSPDSPGRVPAVPTADGSTYWGYPKIPDKALAWWRRLPTQPIPPIPHQVRP
jgi:hypothetical protein